MKSGFLKIGFVAALSIVSLAAGRAVAADDAYAAARAEFEKYHLAVTGKAAPPDAVRFAVDPAVSKSGRDAYSLVSAGKGVTITGSNVRSVLYGVYDLLERRGGCHWFWDGDVVPKKEAIDLSGLDVREEAHFEYRGLRYFAHRGLTRFQAEHWGLEDWKREIDWMLKRRLNVFMLRIGQDDLFQRTFPAVCAYPDPSKPLPGAGKGYDDRSLFWSLQYRGELRRQIQAYAFERGLMVPEDFGTMTHWYSRTPNDFLERRNPPFLPQATSGYAEKNGLVWDIRDGKWVDEYWKLTQTAVAAYGKGAPQQLLHTIGLGERRCYTNRQDNFNLKIEALDKFLSRAHNDYPDAKVLLAGWDFYFTWHPDEVKALIGRLDPKRDIIWDYEGDATRDERPEMKGLNNNFTKWGVVGKFPYTYSIFLAYESALDARANYPLIEERQKIVQNDPACVGYIFWPESSHTDTLCLRYFTANAWSKEAVPQEKVLDEFCASRYGKFAKPMRSIWKKVLPATMLRDWSGNYGKLLTKYGAKLPPVDGKAIAAWQKPVAAVQTAFLDLAGIPWEEASIQRDTIDIARMALDRAVSLRFMELSRDIAAWRAGRRAGADLPGRAQNLAALTDRMADVLALHTDYSLWESFLRLDAIEKVRNPDFPKTLFDNASCRYCRSHQYELARHWYAPRLGKMAGRLAKAVAADDRGAVLFDDSEKERMALMARPMESLRPTLPRTAKNFRATMVAIAALLEGNAGGTAAEGRTYPWRGVLLDESRHFFGKETVKRLLDRMAAERLNVFHWHLTDDQGWRVEIKRYPNLTRRGAQRRLVKDWRPQPFWFDERTEGVYGPYFYTQENVREIVAYAHARGIKVVPEIEMPGHSLAALASYPSLCCFPEIVQNAETFLHPSFRAPGRNMRTYCIGSDETVRFLENVLDEVCELFPDDVVHIGGDEAPRGNWKECPKCQARMKAHGLPDEAALQGWLMNHFVEYLARKGRRTMGWEELLDGKPDPKKVIAQCWHGPERARKAVEAGYDVVMSPPRFCYFDFSQGVEGDDLVYNAKCVVSLEMIQAFNPVAEIPPALHARVLGAECCNWTEGTVSAAALERKMWPRTAAFAARLCAPSAAP